MLMGAVVNLHADCCLPLMENHFTGPPLPLHHNSIFHYKFTLKNENGSIDKIVQKY